MMSAPKNSDSFAGIGNRHAQNRNMQRMDDDLLLSLTNTLDIKNSGLAKAVPQ